MPPLSNIDGVVPTVISAMVNIDLYGELRDERWVRRVDFMMMSL